MLQTAAAAARRGVLLTGVAAVLVTGCRTPPARDAPDATPAAAEPAALPAWDEVQAAHAEWLADLQQFYARGNVELRWTEDGEQHFEQGDVDLWWVLPRRTAMRVEKLGETLLWLGSDQDRYWLFDLIEEPTTLVTAPHDQPLADATGLAVRPLALLDLLMLSPLPDDGAVSAGPDDTTLTLAYRGHSAAVHAVVDAQTYVPETIGLLDDADEIVAVSSLSRVQRVEMAGRPSLGWPQLPTRIEIRAGEAPDAGAGDALTLFLSGPTTLVNEQRLARIFDLDRLTRALQPEVVRTPEQVNGR